MAIVVALAALVTMVGLSPAATSAGREPLPPSAAPAAQLLPGLLAGDLPGLESRPPPPPIGVKPAHNPVLFAPALPKAPLGAAFVPEADVCLALPIEPGRYRVASPYGFRNHPIFGSYLLHAGIDLAAPLGTPIHAVADGTVAYAGGGRLGRSSELVVIEHRVAGTTFYSWYVHMYPEDVGVDVGDVVRAGDVIALVGNNGNSTGPHLHFEIHVADPGLGLRKAPLAARPASATAPAAWGLGAALRAASAGVLTEEDADLESDDGDSPGDEGGDEGQGADGGPDEGDAGGDEDGSPGEPGQGDGAPESGGAPGDGPGDGPDPDDGSSPGPGGDGDGEGPDGEDPGPPPEEDEEGEDSPEGEAPGDEPTEVPSDSGEATTPDPTKAPDDDDPTPTPDETVTDDVIDRDTDEPAQPSSVTRFPARAYGTTVDPLVFLAQLGFEVRAPSACLARRGG